MDPLTVAGIGAGANVLGSLLGGFGAQSAQEADARLRKQLLERQIQEQRQAFADVAPSFDPYMRQGEMGLRGLETLGRTQEDYDYTPSQFEYQGQVQDFLDPSMEFQQEQMQRALEASGASAGNLLSGGALKELQNRSAQLAQTDYGNAYNRMQNDKRFAYGQFMDYANAKRMANADAFNRRMNVAQQQIGQGQFGTSGRANARMGVASNIGEQIGAQINPMAQNAQVGASAPYVMGQGVLGGLVNQDTMRALGSYITPQSQAPQANMGTPVAQGNVRPSRGYVDPRESYMGR